MTGRVRLDSIICLVDAENITSHLVSSMQTALEQIEFADFVIITKMDGADPRILGSIEDIIRRVNALAPIIDTPTDMIPLEMLLDTERITEDGEEILRDTQDEHTHGDALTHFVHKSDYLFDHRLLSEFLRDLPYEVYRVKGFVRLASAPEKVYLIQKVGARFTVVEKQDPPRDQQNTLVFIGKGINPLSINIDLAKCQGR